MKKALLPILIAFAFANLTTAQSLSLFNIEVQDKQGVVLPLALTGGLNAPQVSEADFNFDGKNDIFIFDRIGNTLTLLLYDASLPSSLPYKQAPPELYNTFPILNDWALMRDFNGDNIPDIFTYNETTPDGIRVFKGKRTGNALSFERMRFPFRNVLSFPLASGNSTNLYVNNIDIPTIDDIDGDSDLDILAFEVGGGHVYYYRNQSIERNFQRDSLIFVLQDNCWGRFLDNGLIQTVKLGTRDTCASSFQGSGITTRHPGASITTLDLDGNGTKDALLGSITFPNLTALYNNSTAPQTAVMNQQDNRFPQNTESIDVPIFPAAYRADIGNDGKTDLVVSPSALGFNENKNSLWFYKNTGTNLLPRFELEKKSLFIENMIDLGSGCHPTLVDTDADGLLDLVVGNFSFYVTQNRRDARLFLYKNIGTAAVPRYKLIDDNWLNFSALSDIDVHNFAPSFGDLDGDGDLDLIVGEETGTLFFVENRSGANAPFTNFAPPIPFWKSMELGTAAKPQIIDLDRDGLPDIVSGSRNGTLKFFKNTGARTQPNFTSSPTIDTLGRVNLVPQNEFTAYAAPHFLDFGNRFLLFCGTQQGQVYVFDSITNIRDSFKLKNANYGNLRVHGSRLSPHVRNINTDGKLEMLVGNFRGGLMAFTTTFNTDGSVATKEVRQESGFNIYPNPASDALFIEKLNVSDELSALNFEIFNATGQLLLTKKLEAQTLQTLDISELPAGFFIFKIQEKGRKAQVLKFIKL
jgi:hypothetical protein